MFFFPLKSVRVLGIQWILSIRSLRFDFFDQTNEITKKRSNKSNEIDSQAESLTHRLNVSNVIHVCCFDL